jgi:hypothetical protein
MEIDMKEIGGIMKEMVMGFSFGIMVMFLKENGKMIRWMDKDNLLILKEKLEMFSYKKVF